jgi:hypothetical protein
MADLRPTQTVETDITERIFVAAPGTEILMDEDGSGATEKKLHLLQHAKSGDGHILLVPQPSLTDPNDPLRWSITKKWVVLMNGVAYAFNGAVTGPMVRFIGAFPFPAKFMSSESIMRLKKRAYLQRSTMARTSLNPLYFNL